MKFSNAAVFLASAFGTFGAARGVFQMPDKLPLDVYIKNGEVCDADHGGVGDGGSSDAFVEVHIEFMNHWVLCGRTHVVKNDNTPRWNQLLHCGEISASEWGEGMMVHLVILDQDYNAEADLEQLLGLGWLEKEFKYGQRSYRSEKFVSYKDHFDPHVMCGKSTINFSVITPEVETTICVAKDGQYRREKITASYWDTQYHLDDLNNRGIDWGYEGDLKVVDNKEVRLDHWCNHQPPHNELMFCYRKKGSLGDLYIDYCDADQFENSKKCIIDSGYEIFMPGDRIKYYDGYGIVQFKPWCDVEEEVPTSYGDPHFKTWNGEQFDFHGGCDLVLLQNSQFNHGLGMNVHIRTKIHTWWSSIESAAVQIGDNILQVTGGSGSIKYWINGVENELENGTAHLGDFPVSFKRVNDHQSQTRVDLGNRADAIGIETYKHFVRVNIKDEKKVNFKGSAGLLGSYPTGRMIGRDGKTIVDANEFGQEWMVRPTDSILFTDVEAGDLPLTCPMPTESVSEGRRRLGESAISEEEAALACARVPGAERDACISDVLATNDMDMAGSY